MHGLPANFNAQMFVGKQLTSLTYAENLIHVNFDEELTLTVLDSISYRTDAQAVETVESSPLTTTRLVSLIGRHVTSGKVETPRELVLGLEGGGSMRFVDESDRYESFIIRGPGTEIIV